MDGWIKLYRKLLENDLISDERALQIFIWLLLKVDHKTGEKKIAMRWASEELKMPLSTFHDALQRLIKKYKIANAKVNANYTIISFINWFNYQQTERSTEQTPNAHRTSTIIENKEYIYTPENKKEINLQEIATKYKTTIKEVEMAKEEMDNWLAAKGKHYKDYKAGLRNWVLRNLKEKGKTTSPKGMFAELMEAQEK